MSVEFHFSVSPLLQRLLILQGAARATVENLTENQVKDLRVYYNHALVSQRAVVTDVQTETWKFDLVSSLAAVIFARERVEAHQFAYEQLEPIYAALITALCTDVTHPWFQFAVRNARRPTMIAMPSLPSINLGVDEERFYVQSVSDSWPTKEVSILEGGVLKINPRASRRFIDDMVAGDLGGIELQVTEHEQSFVQNKTVGWITRYETVSRKVTIIEIDPRARGELLVDAKSRHAAHELVTVKEQQLNAFSLNMKLFEDDLFANNLVLSRLLSINQTIAPVYETIEEIDVCEYVHVRGSSHDGLGPLDEEVFLKSLGSMTAKNKIRSALAISTKARLGALNDRGMSIRNVYWNEEPRLESRMIRCGVDGIYVKARVPFDSVFVLLLALVLSALGARALINEEGLQSLDETTSLALALTLGGGLMYHNLRYKSWPIGETVRLKRMCATDEEMSLVMSRHEVISTIAEAGSKGAGMDGILTCAYSDSRDGKFSVTRPLDLESGNKVGLKLRVSTTLNPLWVDLKGVREIVNNGIWHAYGPYLDRSYLELTVIGPDNIGYDDGVLDE